MNKIFKYTIAALSVVFFCTSCGKGDPRKNGIEAGKAQCECYKLEGAEAVDNCLSEIEKKYVDFQTDTAFINAMEEQMINCITDGVVDIVNPIKEAKK